ncbi:MAG: hypothetical protein AAFQ59_15180, partial [Pseudomonadota bacterium]
ASLEGAEFDETTSLTAANTQGAAVREVDFTKLPEIADHIDALFGDASVKLPDGVTPPPHWPDEEMQVIDFVDAWRIWQSTLPAGWDKDIPKR